MAAEGLGGWSWQDEETYRELTQRAAQQARELYHQSEEYRSRRGEAGVTPPEGCAVHSEPPKPTEPRPAPTLEADGWFPCTGIQPGQPWQKEKNRQAQGGYRQPARANAPRETRGGLDNELLLILALLFVLWQEKADKEILFALLYILVV